jgi:Flp pilus assembly pilin Flp
MLNYFKAFLASKGIFASRKGQGLVEYAVLLLLIAGVAYLVVANLGGKITTLFDSAGAALGGG